ncbi:MAG TPA: oligosaccharide flippase family protein [Candidatus Andersenbacteria bacterium]|nr:oligosaccharide flippase family protein [Candidatus Andersenbacteria bacterium]
MNLGKIQLLSVSTKAITAILGIIQTFIIVRFFLSLEEYGIIGLVMSIGGVIGVSQHLGIMDGAIREIAVRTNKDEIGKVFWVSHLARQIVTIPLSLILALLASIIATHIYHRPEIIPYIQIFAGALILQGLQDVLGATLTGMKKFVALYAIQIITGVINIAVFGFLTWKYHVAGFFWSIIITTFIMVILIGIIVGKELSGHLRFPSWIEVKKYGRNLLHISIYMYISRIFYVIWQRLPILILGAIISAQELGYLNIALTFGSKLIILAAALSEVNLSWMSTLFATTREKFSHVVEHTMHRVLILLAGMTVTIIFFTPEILQVFKPESYPARSFIVIMTVAFFLYSLLDIGTSSVFVPANKPKLRALTFGILTLIAALGSWVSIYTPHHITTAVITMLASTIIAFGVMIILAYRMFSIRLVLARMWILIAVLGASSIFLYANPPLLARILIYILVLIYILTEIYHHLIADQRNEVLHKSPIRIICFAGALYDQPSWTNRQHIMARLSKKYPVLYVEPRIWIIRYIAQHLFRPKKLGQFFVRSMRYEEKSPTMFIKSQWNIIPGSREFRWVSSLNHWFNKRSVHRTAQALGFLDQETVIWVYDTEAAEYISMFKDAVVIYDCVDNHASQAGVNRNVQRVHDEERAILKRSDLVTVTSKHLFKLKRKHAKNVHLVLNAGDVELFEQPISKTAKKNAADALSKIQHPILGSVGALDSYKYDFELLVTSAEKNPQWNFVFVGSPIVDGKTPALKRLTKLSNIHMIGSIPREDVPAYVEHFDICLIPYKSNEYNRSSFPLKFWEFMATGKPIIATGLPELEEYNDLIGYARSQKEFDTLIAQKLAEKNTESAQRKKLAHQHGWDQRAKELMKLLEKTVG